MAVIIHTEALSKYYGPVVGVENLSLDVEAGEVFGFLGANGSGKTTTIRLLLGLLRPTSGRAAIQGADCWTEGLRARRDVGYLPGETPIYPEMTAAAYLRYLGRIGPRPVSPALLERLLRRFDVSEVDLGRRLRDHSHGMKRKLGIVQALMTEPMLLVLDEPTTGLDPLMIEAFCQTVEELRRDRGVTIFLSSHVLSEVERLCNRVGLIRRGSLASVQTIEDIHMILPRRVTVAFATPVDGATPSIPGVTLVSREPRRWVLDVRGPLAPLVSSLSGLPLRDLEVGRRSLEDYILKLYSE